MRLPGPKLPTMPGEVYYPSPADEALLAELARRTLGAKARLAGFRAVKYQPDYMVLVARCLRPAMWVTIKLAGPGAPLPCPFDRPAALLHMVRARTAVPVPEVLAADVSYSEWPWRYMIKSYVPGYEWAVVRTGLD